MLKTVKLSDMPIFKRNKDDDKVIKFGINSNSGSKLLYCKIQLDYLRCQLLKVKKLIIVKLLVVIIMVYSIEKII